MALPPTPSLSQLYYYDYYYYYGGGGDYYHNAQKYINPNFIPTTFIDRLSPFDLSSIFEKEKHLHENGEMQALSR